MNPTLAQFNEAREFAFSLHQGPCTGKSGKHTLVSKPIRETFEDMGRAYDYEGQKFESRPILTICTRCGAKQESEDCRTFT